MGFFSKSPEEKRLKELTGGFLLSSSFMNTLKENGIETKIGIEIQKTLKEEIKRGKLSVEDIKPRMDFLISQFSTIKKETRANKVSVGSTKERTLKFLINQKHNLNTCPNCRTKYLKSDVYCYNCGLKLSSADFNKTSDSDLSRQLDDLEKLYDYKVIKKENNNFKFAYVIYLDYLNKNKSSIPQNRLELFNVSLKDLKSKAIDDKFIKTNFDLDKLTVKELKNILRNNNLKVSGRKNELIERIASSNLQLNEQVTGKAVEFVKQNAHIIYYYNHPELKSVLDVDKYADIFDSKSELNKKTIENTVISYLNSKEINSLYSFKISEYKSVLYILSAFYEKSNDVHLILETYFKLFILELNNYSETSKKPEPQYCKINPVLTSKIIATLNKYSVDSIALKTVFQTSYDSIKSLKPVISADESLIYFLKIFHEDDVFNVENTIHQKYLN